MPKYPSSAQIRAGRGLLGWTKAALAQKVGISVNTVTVMERDDKVQNQATRERVQEHMERHGILFLDDDGHAGDGVRFEASRKINRDHKA